MSRDRTGNWFPIVALGCAVISGCSSASKSPAPEGAGTQAPPVAEAPPTAPAQTPGETPDLRATVESLRAELAEARRTIDQLMNVKKPTVETTKIAPTQVRGSVPESPLDASDPESGFVSDSALQSYRQAMLLYQTHKYPEAVLAFSAFLERYGDHPLAGSAQFYSGEAYFRQKEFKLAWQEYLRVVATYDRSPHISHALARLTTIAEGQGLQREATDFRQKLSSLFAASPAVAWVKTTASEPAKAAPAAPPAAANGGAIDLPPETPTAPLPPEGQTAPGEGGAR